MYIFKFYLKIYNKIELNRGNLPKGFYLIELRGTKIYRGKILIE